MFEKIEKEFGKLDVLFNNAGGGEASGPLDECPTQTFESTLNINVTGGWLVMK